MIWRWIRQITIAVLLGLGILGMLLVVAIYRESRSNDSGPAEAIVVMGAAQFNGIPSAVFQARLDTARRLFEEGAAPLIVVSGGKMAGDEFTEAEAGRNYLVNLGVPESVILLEHLSTDTEESLTNVAGVLEPLGITDILVVSDGFHLYRSALHARGNGLSPSGNAADASPIEQGTFLEFRYVLREAAAVAGHYLNLD